MSGIKKVDELLKMLIKELPNLQNGYDIIEKLAKSIDHTIELSIFKKIINDSYTEFENWLNGLFQLEPVQDKIIAFNFGLFESEDGIQIYITGSSEWDSEDEDWVTNNDYFPEDRYPKITLYNELYNFWENKFYLGLFLTISSTIIYTNTYLLSNPSRFPKEVIFATGFDDGDLYSFSKKTDEKVMCLSN